MRISRSEALAAVVAAVAALLVVPTAEAEPWGRPGPYVGLSFAWPATVGVDSDDHDGDFGVGYGGALHVGQRLHPRFAVEGVAEFTRATGFGSALGQALTGGDKADELTSTALTVNGKFYVFTSRVQPFLLAGVGGGVTHFERSNSRTDDTIGYFAGRLGIGLDLYATPAVVIGFELSGGVGVGPDDASYAQMAPRLGLSYRF
ncbi:MAG: outer membrane beta-barrel protein [Myxococcota bacterium]